MKNSVAASLIFSLLCAQVLFAQCSVNVTINEGDQIEMCPENLQSISGANGFVSYAWTGPENFNGQAITPSLSGMYYLAGVDGDGCISVDSILVTIHATPSDNIISSEGDPICTLVGTILSLSGTYSSYQWITGETTPTIMVDAAGSYSVSITDANTCTADFNINLSAHSFDLEVVGNGLCSGGSVSLQASGGTSYLWSTGETSSTIVVEPSDPTVFTVTVTNGTCSENISHSIVGGGVGAEPLPDTIFITPDDNIFISGPQEFETYSWSPAHSISHPNDAGGYYIDDSSQLIVLTAVHEDGCTWIDSVMVIVVDLQIPNAFSPNQDGYNDRFVIPDLGNYRISFTAWNRWGDIVYESENYDNTWDGTCQGPICMGGGNLPEGTYFYMMQVEEIILKGYITLKR